MHHKGKTLKDIENRLKVQYVTMSRSRKKKQKDAEEQLSEVITIKLLELVNTNFIRFKKYKPGVG